MKKIIVTLERTPIYADSGTGRGKVTVREVATLKDGQNGQVVQFKGVKSKWYKHLKYFRVSGGRLEDGKAGEVWGEKSKYEVLKVEVDGVVVQGKWLDEKEGA